MNREGLGARSTDSNNITREEADYVLQKYASSGQVSDIMSDRYVMLKALASCRVYVTNLFRSTQLDRIK